MSGYELTRLAERDLAEIHARIAEDNPVAALAWVDEIIAKVEMLAQWPRLGRTRPDRGTGLRSWPVGEYLIVYLSKQRFVTVVRVLHGKRHLPGQFGR